MQPDDSTSTPAVPGWSVPPLPTQSSAWRPPLPDADAPPAALPPVPQFLARPQADPAAGPAPAGSAAAAVARGGRTRMAVLTGAAAAVLIVVAGLTTTLALRPDVDHSQLRTAATAQPNSPAAADAERNSEPSSAPSLSSAPSPESDAGQAAAGAPADPGEDATTSTAGTPTTSAAAPAPTTRAPATSKPEPPAAEPPATEAPATKAPATKAPAPKAPEINKAVAKSGTRGAGPCSAKLVAGYGCLQTYGDVWWVYDTLADGHSAVVFWEVGSGAAKRTGQCANSLGNGKIGACNKNYPEGSTGRAKVCIMDWDTKQVHECTAYFSFKTS